MKEFFRNLNWFERIFPIISILVVIISFSVGVEKNWLSLIYSLVGVIETFIVAKGLVIAPFFTVTLCVLYLFLSLSQNYYGEVVIAAINIIIGIAIIISWLKNKSKQNTSEVQVNKIGWLEYVLMLVAGLICGIGCYFMLKAFNTDELIISTISVVVSLISAYLMVRRSKFYAAGYLINDIIVIVLWSMTIKNMGLVFLPTILGFVIYFISDIYGLINWKLMERKQNKQKEIEVQKSGETIEKIDAMWRITFEIFRCCKDFADKKDLIWGLLFLYVFII